MKLLVYRWGSISEPLFCKALKELSMEYVEFGRRLKNYHFDAEFAQELISIIHRERIEAIFSFDYFPMIAMLCEINKIPYISWIYDCPMRTLQSKTLTSPYNYLFCFDRKYTEYLETLGAVHCVHYPLAADCCMLERAMAKSGDDIERYTCDISFIGNLYNGGNNRFRLASFTEETTEWINKILQIQTMNYKENIIQESLLTREDVVAEIVKKCELSLGLEYIQDDVQMASDVLGMEVSAREREGVLQSISKMYPIQLYTASEIPLSLQNANLISKGYADYENEMPLIFHNSRINLNITSRTIETGIPQRVFDILACGGFCLTNYQEEIAEYFEDGKELVMFHSPLDLLEKISYYLEHEEERRYIAKCGYEKVSNRYNIKDRVCLMHERVFLS